MSFTPIGYVARQASAPVGADKIPALRAETVELHIDPTYADALLGIEVDDALVIMTYFHLASRDVRRVHPRGDRDRPLRGVFATRSPSRPNPIGLSTVRVVQIEGTVLKVRGLDALDGSPILDIKSYSEGFDTPYPTEPSQLG